MIGIKEVLQFSSILSGCLVSPSQAQHPLVIEPTVKLQDESAVVDLANRLKETQDEIFKSCRDEEYSLYGECYEYLLTLRSRLNKDIKDLKNKGQNINRPRFAIESD